MKRATQSAETLRVLATGALFLALCPAPTFGVQEQTGEPRSFALPLARDARTLAEEAREHIASERWNAALATLQEMIELHAGHVLPDGDQRTRDVRPRPFGTLNTASYTGAAQWATDRLRALPAEAQKLYRQRFDRRARAGLQVARAEASRKKLVHIATRWPLCSAAAEAYWTLGDIELERGHAEQALVAWDRAAGITTADGRDPGALLAARRTLAAKASKREAAKSPLLLPGNRVANGPVPQRASDSWNYEGLDLRPFVKQGGGAYAFNITPTLVGDKVIVSTTFRIFALDAYSGELLWEFGPVRGWEQLNSNAQEDLFKGLSEKYVLSWASVEGNIVVAGMQIPYSITENQQWQGISIMAAIPERRLVAVDLETGNLLWDHVPDMVFDTAAGHDGSFVFEESTSPFAEKMLVAAPPTIVGSRVLVPCYRMEGRIDYHVACYELETGALLWSRRLVSGQRERNMFGRPEEEFVGSPLAVAGGRVLALTELGTVSALDIFSGNILWESEYPQIELRKTINYNAANRSHVWRETAPIALEKQGVVLCTPSDSEYVVAFDLESGRKLWWTAAADLDDSRRSMFECMIGAEDDTIWFGGNVIAAFQKPGGLAQPDNLTRRWAFPVKERSGSSRSPRPVLAKDVVVIPTREERIVLDKTTGELVRTLSDDWSYPEMGAVAIGDGVLFTLSRQQLTGFFDWDTLLQRHRERLAETPDAPAVLIDTAELFARRAEAVFQTGEAGRALDYIGQAKAILEPRLFDDGPSWAGLARSLHGILRTEAELRAELADTNGALRALEQAKELATGELALRDTLIQQEGLLRDRRMSDVLDVLDELESRCGTLSLPESILLGNDDWLVGRDTPLDRSLVDGWQQLDLPIACWVTLKRADLLARHRDAEGSLANLHRALATWGPLAFEGGFTMSELLQARIARRVEIAGSASYLRFENEARELLVRAEETNDPLLYERIGELYPHSKAAERALDSLLEWAFREGRPERVARIVYEALSRPHSPQREVSDIEALLRLGAVLEGAGNLAFLPGLVESAAKRTPLLRPSLPSFEGRTLSEWLNERRTPPDVAPPRPTFDASVRLTQTWTGMFTFLGELRPAAPSPDSPVQHVYISESEGALYAFSSDRPGTPAWVKDDIEFNSHPDRSAIAPERVIIGGRSRVKNTLMALDPRGEVAWEIDLGEQRVHYVRASSGVVLVMLGKSSSKPQLTRAYDAQLGIELWELPLRRERYFWIPPVFGEGYAVLFHYLWGQPSYALVVDLYSGRIQSDFEVDVHRHSDKSAWIENGKLLVPSFTAKKSKRSGITAFSLAQGNELWSYDFSAEEQLYALGAFQADTYLVAYTVSPQGPGRSGVYHLNTDIGTARKLVDLRPDEQVLGLPEDRRTELSAPFLFLRPRDPLGETLPIQAIQLPNQNRWTHHLPPSDADLYDRTMPMPAVSDTTVAMTYVTKDGARMPDEIMLVFLNARNGSTLDRRVYEKAPRKVTEFELRGLGDALFLIYRGAKSRIDVLERK